MKRTNRKITPFSKQDSIHYAKQLIKKKTNIKKLFKPGNLLLIAYDAKDKTKRWDKTPLVLVLRNSKSYMLGLNFHWAPFKFRISLIEKILRVNKTRIQNNLPLQYTYSDIKEYVSAARPIIRLYIKNRIAPEGVLIPDDQLMNVARLRMETFTG